MQLSEQHIAAQLSDWLRARAGDTKGIDGSPLFDEPFLNKPSPNKPSPNKPSPNKPLNLQALSGDAGMRRYFQIEGLPSCLAVYAPIDSEDSKAFVGIAEFLRQQGVHAPQVYAVDYERGFLLIENLGERLLLSELNADSVEQLYAEALMNLLTMQQGSVPPGLVPQYDAEKLLREMMLFPHWFIQQLLGCELNESEQQQLQAEFDLIIESALEQPQVFVHRDYHSRNLIVSDVGNFGVIDFQDAVLGPITYDVVSLLRDCYIRWPREDVKRWLLVYANLAVEMGLLKPMARETFLRWFDWMGLQRHIKVLGIFSRLYLRDNKPRYLHDLPLVMRYVIEILRQYDEFKSLNNLFEEKLLPLAKRQNWYRDIDTAGE